MTATAQVVRQATAPAAAQVVRQAPSRAAARGAWQAPVAERFVAGPAPAGVAPWGLAHSPVTGKLMAEGVRTNRW